MRCYIRSCPEDSVCENCEGCEEHCHCTELGRPDLAKLFDPDDMEDENQPYFWNR